MAGSRCTVCTHPLRAAVEYDLATGMHSMRATARQYGLTHDSIRRHLIGHVSPALREAAREAVGLGAARIVERLRESAQSATDTRRDAEDHGTRRDVARLVEVEQKAWGHVADRLGHDRGEALADLRDAEALADGIGRLALADPGAGEALARALEDLDRPDLATTVRGLVHRSTRKELTT